MIMPLIRVVLCLYATFERKRVNAAQAFGGGHMKSPTAILAAGVCLLAAHTVPIAAHAQTAAEFYNNRQMVMLISTTVGGGYDIFGRMFARHMGKYLPGGTAKFTVRNMPGAGGLIGTNHMFNVAERDGSTIAVVNREALTEPLFSPERTQARFDPRRLTWLGSPNIEVGMIYMSATSRVQSIKDAQQRESTLGTSSGLNSTGVVVPKLLNMLIGTKFKVITGYPGSMESILAMERNEVDGRYSPGWAGPEANKVNDLVAAGKARLIAYLSPEDSAAFKHLPNVLGLATTPEYKQILEIVLSNQGLGRPFFAPPGVPADRAKALQDAFMATMKDPDYLAEAAQYKFEITPIDGPAMARYVDRIYATPASLLKRAIEMMNQAQKQK
jgi:tripartite-type tricarboxylate transporter receptor subunit TctC